MVKKKDSGARLPGVKSQLCPFELRELSELLYPFLSILIHKMGMDVQQPYRGL